MNYLSCGKLLGVPRNTPPSQGCGESVCGAEQHLSVHSYWWQQVTLLVQCFHALSMFRGKGSPQSLAVVVSLPVTPV